jgi:polysaccharide biosynthesis/export protein
MVRALLLTTLAVGCGTLALADPIASPVSQSSVSLADRPALNGAPAIPSDYTISSQDVLAIDVFGVPELSQTSLQVDTAGTIAMPFIGRVQAVGLTTSQLSQRIAAQLDRRYVKDPIVTVTIKDAASQKVTVDGQVTQPGIYEISPNTTLTQAVALAKGPSNIADTHSVAIVRVGDNGRTITSYDLDQIHDGKATDPFVRANDEVVVDVSGSRKFVRDFGQPLSSALGLLTFWHP